MLRQSKDDYEFRPSVTNAPDYPITIRFDGAEYGEALARLLHHIHSEGIPISYLRESGAKVFFLRRDDPGKARFHPPSGATKIADGMWYLTYSDAEEAVAVLKPMLTPDAVVSALPGKNAVHIRCRLKSYQRLEETLYMMELKSALSAVYFR